MFKLIKRWCVRRRCERVRRYLEHKKWEAMFCGHRRKMDRRQEQLMRFIGWRIKHGV